METPPLPLHGGLNMAAITPVADDLDRVVSDKAIATIAKKDLDQWDDLHQFGGGCHHL